MSINKSLLFRFLSFAIISAIVCTICDANHIHTQTLSYTYPFLLGQAWFVFPGFVVTFMVMAVVYNTLIKAFPKQIAHIESGSSGSRPAFVENMIFFMMVYLMSGFGNHEPDLLSFIFYVSFFIRLAYTYDRTFLFIVAIILCIGGMIGEGMLGQFDLGHYREPEIFGVPYWLGGVYMHGALALRAGMRYLVYTKE